jgi:hypothetical protein
MKSEGEFKGWAVQALEGSSQFWRIREKFRERENNAKESSFYFRVKRRR